MRNFCSTFAIANGKQIECYTKNCSKDTTKIPYMQIKNKQKYTKMKTKKEIEALINELQQENKDFQEEYSKLKSQITSDLRVESIKYYIEEMDRIDTIINENNRTIRTLLWALRG